MSDASAVVLQAWKDEEYRSSLPAEVRDQIPPRPENFETLDEKQLEDAAGGITPTIVAAAPWVGAAVAVPIAAGTLYAGIESLTDDKGVKGD